eukprot:7216904-Pyramimonas_sp.AAC.1
MDPQPPARRKGRKRMAAAKESALPERQGRHVTGGASMKALRLPPRLGRVNARECAGHQMSNPLLARLPRSKRATKMPAV